MLDNPQDNYGFHGNLKTRLDHHLLPLLCDLLPALPCLLIGFDTLDVVLELKTLPKKIKDIAGFASLYLPSLYSGITCPS